MNIRENPEAYATFQARMAVDPAGAVRRAHALGLVVDEGDVAIPFSTQLAELAPSMRREFEVAHHVELAGERTALALARASATLIARRSIAATAQREADREARIAARAAELEAEDLAARRARFRAQAVAEIDGTPPPATSNNHPRPRGRTSTERNA